MHIDEYPDSPGFKAAGTSAEAAELMAPSAKTLRADVLRTMIRAQRPMTADEIATEMKRSILSVRPRVSELHRLGMVRPTGGRSKNDSGMSAALWEVVRPSIPEDGQ
jgi:predicted transcriptional regulator